MGCNYVICMTVPLTFPSRIIVPLNFDFVLAVALDREYWSD